MMPSSSVTIPFSMRIISRMSGRILRPPCMRAADAAGVSARNSKHSIIKQAPNASLGFCFIGEGLISFRFPFSARRRSPPLMVCPVQKQRAKCSKGDEPSPICPARHTFRRAGECCAESSICGENIFMWQNGWKFLECLGSHRPKRQCERAGCLFSFPLSHAKQAS